MSARAEQRTARPEGTTSRLQPFLWPLRRPQYNGADSIPEADATARVMLRDALYRRSLAVADLISAMLALTIAVAVVGDDRLTPSALVLLPGVVLVAKAIGLYDRDEHLLRKTTLDEAPRLFQVAAIYALCAWVASDVFVQGDMTRTEVVALWLTLFASTVALRTLARAVIQRALAPERLLVVGDRRSAEWLSSKLARSHTVRASIIGYVPLTPGGKDGTPRNGSHPPVLGALDSVGLVLGDHSVDRVVMAPGEHAEAEDILHAIRLVKALGAKVTVLPRLFEVVGSSVEFDNVDGVTLLGVRRHGLTQSSRILKRTMDVVVATLALVVLAPLFAMIALAIKLTSPGPVFFRQRRIGCRDSEFDMFKFRTMIDGADAQKAALREMNEAGGGIFKIADDPRITRVGRLLRKASLDELPQLINVLRGQMSLVGPRPLVPDEDRFVEGLHRRRLIVKPGMTGLWQIFGSARIPLDEMVKIDYLYGANWSLWLDVKVLLRTIPYVLSQRGI